MVGLAFLFYFKNILNMLPKLINKSSYDNVSELIKAELDFKIGLSVASTRWFTSADILGAPIDAYFRCFIDIFVHIW